MDVEKKIICGRCGVELEMKTVDFNYMDFAFSAEVPKCPKCGYVYISEELARGRMLKVEMSLEDK